MKRKTLAMSKPIPVKLDLPLLQRIEALSERLGEAKSTIMRMAMRVGLDALEKAFQANPADLLKIISGLDSVKEVTGIAASGVARLAREEPKPASPTTSSNLRSPSNQPTAAPSSPAKKKRAA